MSLQIAVPTRCYDKPLRQAIELASESGALGVQFDARSEVRATEFTATGRRQLLHYLDELGLKLASFAFATRRALLAPDQLDARLAAIREAMKFASTMHVRTMTLRIGRIPADPEDINAAVLTEVLNDLARYSNHVGVVLAITPSGDSPETLKRTMAAITGGPIGVDFDPASFVIGGHSPSESFRILHPIVTHFRARDAVHGFDGSPQEVVLGRGDVIWDELMVMLQESNFNGWTTVDRSSGDDKPGDLSRAVEYLKNVTTV